MNPPRMRTIGQLVFLLLVLVLPRPRESQASDAHWAFVPPAPPKLPRVRNVLWPRNSIDYFILARLEQEALAPALEAERTALIRRLTLDLAGLPPTPEEVDLFLADISPDAYEKLVDRLLASPRYGERMAFRWLEAARYADTNGYQSDGERYMWRWRDWVIEAFNQNLPFHQFTIEQIAGDMLPGATLDQRLASGFNRNHRGNGEGGIIAEEYAVEYVVDRVDTTCTVWLGLTMGCARCHDHKYDPFSQREFYQLFAYFNNVPEKGKAMKFGNSPPLLKTPTPLQQRRLTELKDELAAVQARCTVLGREVAAAQADWEETVRRTFLASGNARGEEGDAEGPSSAGQVGRGGERIGSAAGDAESLVHREWSVTKGLLASFDLDGVVEDARGGTNQARVAEGRLAFAPGVIGHALVFDGKRFVELGNLGDFGFYDKFSLAAWVFLPNQAGGTIVSRTGEIPQAEGYTLCVTNGRVQLNLVKRWLDDSLRVETMSPLGTGRWHHVAAIYDGSRVAEGVRIYVNGTLQALKTNLDELNQSFNTTEPFRLGTGGGEATRFHGLMDDVRIYGRALKAEEVLHLATADSVKEIVSTPPARRTEGQSRKLRACFLEAHAPQHLRSEFATLDRLRDELEAYEEALPTTMVMAESPEPKGARVLIRGEYDKPGPRVEPGVPSALFQPGQKGHPASRLEFARWLVSPSNPLTARVAVNQYWQRYFGTGLVKTAEDFGTRGELPSHPELLDWLAAEFVRTGWDVKAMQRLIVTSATYRQSSRAAPDAARRDPDNRLLARGPRLRLDAEIVRDQALMFSGLLVEQLGGASVKPYQPPGLWKELSGSDYVQDKGASLYRRGVYTFWKRTSPPPMLTTFDAAGREACSVLPARARTPLQALALMNDVIFVEASRKLAEGMLLSGGVSLEEKISFAFRTVTARHPADHELEVLLAGLKDHLAYYQAHPEAAAALIAVGDSARDSRLAASELAAYNTIASLMLNLDEVITKH